MYKPIPPINSQRSNNALLLTLSLVYGIQYLDQILLGLFIQPIKAEYGLSDTQVGMLTGMAFTLLFVSLGIPLARLADRGNRKHIVVASAAIFSVATILCGFTVGFLSLFITRMMVAVGEAGTVPASVSILADTFPPAKRRIVMSLHSCGGYLGTAIGLLLVGLATAILDWRQIFGIAGALGLILAFCVALFVREPTRTTGPSAPETLLKDVWVLLKVPAYVLLILGMGIGAIASAAAINWIPAFLARSHAMSQREIVLFLAAAWGIGATSGSVVFGFVTTWLNRNGGRRPLLVVASLMVLFPAICCAAFLAKAPALTLLAFGAALFIMGGIRGPAFAAVQDLVSPSRQATANAVLMFSMYIIGVTLGPLLTGVVSDSLALSLGQEALRYALLAVLTSAGCAGACFIAAAAWAMGRTTKHATSSRPPALSSEGAVKTAPLP